MSRALEPLWLYAPVLTVLLQVAQINPIRACEAAFWDCPQAVPPNQCRAWQFTATLSYVFGVFGHDGDASLSSHFALCSLCHSDMLNCGHGSLWSNPVRATCPHESSLTANADTTVDKLHACGQSM